jgi:DNA polymerase sigma
LVIEDPLNPTNNIGKSTFNFDKIRTAFSNAHDQIEEMLREFIEQADEDEVKTEGNGSAENGVVWKKKLDILSKILALPSSTTAAEEEQSYN